MNNKVFTLLVLGVAQLLCNVANAKNDIEPGKEFYTVVYAPKPIVLDGNLSEWSGVPVLADPKFAVPKYSATNANPNYVLFEQYAGGTWSGPDDQTSAVQITYDNDNVYFGFVVTDDYHENAANSAWNGDSIQLMIANAARDTQVALYNYALGGVEGAIGAVIVNHEAGPGGDPACNCPTEAVITRNATTHRTTYEIKLPKASLGLTTLKGGPQFGLGMAINDGDNGTGQAGQKGWGGLGAHAIVFGKTPSETALITLTKGNDIEPGKEYYTALRTTNTIVVDGVLSEWTGAPVLADPKFAVPKYSGTNDSPNYVLFEQYAGGTWTGPDDQTSAVQVVYDADNVYFGFVVTDDYHENAANSAWNGDSIQLMIAGAGRTNQVALYNYALGGIEGALGSVIVNHEAGPGGDPACNCPTVAVITRNATTKKTTYEIKLPVAALGLTGPLTVGTQFGLGMAINDGDSGAGQAGQKGWGGLGAHSIVFGKTPSETALVTLGTTVSGSDRLFLSAINPGIDSFSFRVNDKGASILAPASAKLIIDGQTVTLTASPKTLDATDFTYKRPAPYPPGSTHTYSIEVKDTLGNTVTSPGTFQTIAYNFAIGANFQGRGADQAPVPPILKSETAGFVPQANWNNISDSQTTPTAENGTTGPLAANRTDGAAIFTPVTITFAGNDSWNSDGPAVTPNDRLMLGIIKRQQAGTTGTFSVNGLGAGPYDMYVYFTMNADGVEMDLTSGSKTFFVIEQHQFAGAFIECLSTSAAARDTGNYVKFAGLTPVNGTIPLTMKYVSGGDGCGVAAIQIVGASFPTNTTPVSALTQQPANTTKASGYTATFSIAFSGPWNVQWFKNDVAIAGATSASYTTPPLVVSDNGAKFKAVVSNNINSVTSTEATLTVLAKQPDVVVSGFAKYERFNNINGVAITDLTGNAKYTANTPDVVQLIAGLDSPNGVGDNYGARITGFITPTESGDYHFFIRSDDASQFFLSANENSPDPLMDVPTVEEPGCCDPFKEPGGVVETTENPIALVAGKRYAFVVLLKEGGGGDYVQVAMRKVGDTTAAASLKPISGKLVATTVDPTGAAITITQQPQNQSVIENETATFTVAATAASAVYANPPIAYQWQKNGVDIAGATGPTYTTGTLQLSDSGAKFKALISSPGTSVTSAEVTLTVLPDTIPPKVVSVGSMKHLNTTEIGVVFDEPLIAAAATTLANYSLNSGSVTAARYVTNSSGINSRQRGVVLTATGITPGTTYTLTVKNVSDLKGNAITNVTAQFTASAFTWASIGRDPGYDLFKADALAAGANGFNLVSGGQAYWGTDDDITMVYEEVTGDFDKVARVEYSDPSSNWARSGISAREALNEGAPTTDATGANPASRYQMVLADPTTKFDGTLANNSYETNRRLNTGGATSSAAGGGTPAYPNAWLRLKRVGQVFTMYRGSDGTTWTELGSTDFSVLSTDPPLPAKMFVGPTFGPENGNVTDTALRKQWATRIRDYGNLPSPRPTLTVSRSGNNVTISWSGTGGTLQSASVVAGPYTNVGTANPATIPIVPTENRFYRVTVP